MTPKISIIVPCYGVEKYLDRCLESLVNQTLHDIEVILVDDKSPDCVPAMCDAWAEKDSRIKVVHKIENEGLGFARNTGLEIAEGEYIAFVDSDDFVKLTMYETLYSKAYEKNADVVYCNCIFYKSELEQESRIDVKSELEFSTRNEIDHFMLDMIGPEPEYPRSTKYMQSVWHGIYRRRIFEEHNIQFVSERQMVSEDIVFNVDFLPHCSRIIYIPDALCMYCLNENSLSHTINDAKYTRMKKFIIDLNTRLRNVYPESLYKLHFQRYCIFVYLSIATCASRKMYKSINFSDVLNDSFWENCILGYPQNRMTIKYRTILFMTKYRLLWPFLQLILSIKR